MWALVEGARLHGESNEHQPIHPTVISRSRSAATSSTVCFNESQFRNGQGIALAINRTRCCQQLYILSTPAVTSAVVTRGSSSRTNLYKSLFLSVRLVMCQPDRLWHSCRGHAKSANRMTPLSLSLRGGTCWTGIRSGAGGAAPTACKGLEGSLWQ